MLNPPIRGLALALALVAGAFGAAPAHAADEITALRELIQQQQTVIAAQEQQLKDLARRVDALAAGRPAQGAPAAEATPTRPTTTLPATPRRAPPPRATAVAPVAMQPEAQAAGAAAASAIVSCWRPRSRPARTNEAARRKTSHSKGPGFVSSKSLMSKMTLRSGAANMPKFDRWASPHSWVTSPEFGIDARSAVMMPAPPR